MCKEGFIHLVKMSHIRRDFELTLDQFVSLLKQWYILFEFDFTWLYLLFIPREINTNIRLVGLCF